MQKIDVKDVALVFSLGLRPFPYHLGKIVGSSLVGTEEFIDWLSSAGSCSSCRTGKSPNRTTTMGRRGISSIRPGVRVLRGIQEFHFASENGSTVCRIDPKTPTIPSFLDIYPLSGMSE
ncbi:hypothetical protein HZH66_011186 [Vespula vulgaris]|uniref:Uncharacterized protein n=1 Tax=Vespula vulgaris TaxID=7454 RepID=A0A834MWZ9_VESVU|nr:hypothetical protein HZH66_011186 [Vespula vulgaris]